MSKGLLNLGNTCYMNSALQCLSHLEALTYESHDFTLNRRKRTSSNDYGLMTQWLHFQQKMWDDTENSVINTGPILQEFIRLCKKQNIYFESFQQNDASDFIRIFLDLLHDSIKRKVSIEYSGEPVTTYDKLKVKSIKKWGEYFDSSYSYIIEKFYSQLLEITSCPDCDYLTTNHDPVLVITLDLLEEHTSLDDCIQSYIQEHQLDEENSWKCEKCQDYVCPHKKTNFWKLSPILIFQIKQYTRHKKLNHHIEFTETLSMDEYCLSKTKGNMYSLMGICIHNGGLNGGHYYAMCKNYKTDMWATYNDSSVVSTTFDNVLEQTPYCFFYNKI